MVMLRQGSAFTRLSFTTMNGHTFDRRSLNIISHISHDRLSGIHVLGTIKERVQYDYRVRSRYFSAAGSRKEPMR
jgi:hypothetical protein